MDWCVLDETDDFIDTIMYGPPRHCKRSLLDEDAVCVNVSGLLVEVFSPGHDDDPRVPVLISRTVSHDHYR
jgi:hypothetical protein